METTRRNLVLLVTIGLGIILLAARLSHLPDQWLSVLIFSGGWLMAVSMLYQIKLYAVRKDIQYYVLLVFTLIFWLSMTVVSLFQLGLLTGWFHWDLG